MSAAKVELGRYLFYDTRLSVNGKQACATCHKQEFAFTDGHPVAIGATGEKHPRGSMSLVNVAYSAPFTWGNPEMKELEKQALVPMFGEHPVELGLKMGDGFLARLSADPRYQELFARAYPADSERFTLANITKAIACFERSIISARSHYDRYHYGGDDTAVSDSAKRGEVLFFSAPLSCFRCHGNFNFSGTGGEDSEFHNTGLYNGPATPLGISEFTHDPKDLGKFKAPTLRNIALTAPYMHDGSIATLDGVLDHYSAGGRAGKDNPLKDPLIGGFTLSDQDRKDLIEFLKALTDDAVLRDPRFSNPW